MKPTPRAPSERRRIRWLVHIGFAVLGLGAMAWFVHRAGADAVLDAFRQNGLLLVPVFLLEGGRIATDAFRTQRIYRSRDRKASWPRLFGAQLASYPLALLVPAGGAASEAFKAVVLADEVGAPLAAVAAVTNQALTLWAGALISIPCFIAAFSEWHWRGLTIAIGAQMLSSSVFGTGIQIASRKKVIGRSIGRISSQAGVAVASFHEEAILSPSLPVAPLLVAVASRALQLAQLTILLYGAGGATHLRSAFLGYGVHLFGTAAGDLVPGQMGATDATFSVAAGPLGIDPARALMIPLAMHGIQLAWAVIGAVSPFGKQRHVVRREALN